MRESLERSSPGRYALTSSIPPLVRRAMDLAHRLDFKQSSISEVGRLLQILAAQHRSGRIAEIGTGCGVGAAWIASGMAPTASLVTVEIDAGRAAAAQSLFEAYPNVKVIHGDWHDILAFAPFVMIFADGGKAKVDGVEILLNALIPGGLIVLDDLTPEDQWPPEWLGKPDPVRTFWLNDPRLLATELLTTPSSAVIVAVRRMEGDPGG